MQVHYMQTGFYFHCTAGIHFRCSSQIYIWYTTSTELTQIRNKTDVRRMATQKSQSWIKSKISTHRRQCIISASSLFIKQIPDSPLQPYLRVLRLPRATFPGSHGTAVQERMAGKLCSMDRSAFQEWKI